MLPLRFLPPIPSFVHTCPPAEDRMTVRDIFYLLAPAARQRREEDQMREGSLLGAVGWRGRFSADGRTDDADGRARAGDDSLPRRTRCRRRTERPISHSKSLIEIRRGGKKERESCPVRPTINKVPRDRVTPPFVMKLYGAVGGTNGRTENGPVRRR